MPPGGGGGEDGCTGQGHLPASVRLDEDDPSHSVPPLPAIVPVASQEERQRHEHEQQPAASLPEGPLVEILARVPYRSLCRFKCVSRPWLALCSSPDIRRRSPQTLSGFFYHNYASDDPLRFRNLSGRGPPLVDPSLPFLRGSYINVRVTEFCGGLLLCACTKLCSMLLDYVVCNPATGEWTVLPHMVSPDQEFSHQQPYAYLGFDPAVPSRFLVFAPLTDGPNDSGKVAIYSSETGQWTYVQSKWTSGTALKLVHSAFLNGTMHWSTSHYSVVTVDSEGKVWREIEMPYDVRNNFDRIFIGRSQGSLYVCQVVNAYDSQLHIWVLEDYGTGKWTLKHTVNVSGLFGRHRRNYYPYSMFAFHPDDNVIFLTDKEEMTLSYDLDNQEVHVICKESIDGIPYIPCFADLPSAGH